MLTKHKIIVRAVQSDGQHHMQAFMQYHYKYKGMTMIPACVQNPGAGLPAIVPNPNSGV